MPPKGMEKDFMERHCTTENQDMKTHINCLSSVWNSIMQMEKVGKAYAFITPDRIKRRGRATIVEWADETQTKIVRPADVEDAELYTVFCIALAKKLYDSNSALKKVIHFADEERQLAAEQEIAEMKKQAHEERMRKQLDRSTKRIARLARRAFKRDVIAHLATKSIQVEEESEENEPC